MIVLHWLRFALAALLMLGGLTVLFGALVGIFRLDNALNRIHVAAKCDTFGLLLTFSSLIVMSGWSLMSLKLLVIIVFFWLSVPVANHLLAHMELVTNPDIKDEFEILHQEETQ